MVAKFGSSPNAAANSFKVSNASGAEFTIPATEVFTYSSVASFLLPSSLFLPEVYNDYQRMKEAEHQQKELEEKLEILNPKWNELAEMLF